MVVDIWGLESSLTMIRVPCFPVMRLSEKLLGNTDAALKLSSLHQILDVCLLDTLVKMSMMDLIVNRIQTIDETLTWSKHTVKA